jgi:ankyrin repeat protein
MVSNFFFFFFFLHMLIFSVLTLAQQLMEAVSHEHILPSLRLRLMGANVNHVQAGNGKTPLHVAAAAGHVSQVEFLVLNGGFLHLVDEEGRTPREVATDSEVIQCIERHERKEGFEEKEEEADKVCLWHSS